MFRQLVKDIRLKIRWKILILLTKIKVWGDPKMKENSQVLESHKKNFKIQMYARKKSSGNLENYFLLEKNKIFCLSFNFLYFP